MVNYKKYLENNGGKNVLRNTFSVNYLDIFWCNFGMLKLKFLRKQSLLLDFIGKSIFYTMLQEIFILP